VKKPRRPREVDRILSTLPPERYNRVLDMYLNRWSRELSRADHQSFSYYRRHEGPDRETPQRFTPDALRGAVREALHDFEPGLVLLPGEGVALGNTVRAEVREGGRDWRIVAFEFMGGRGKLAVEWSKDQGRWRVTSGQVEYADVKIDLLAGGPAGSK
jgi:hypothetical protein